MDHVLSAIAGLATRRPRFTILVLVLATIPAGFVASRLKVSTSRTALVSEEEPHWKRYMAFARDFGIPEDLVVVARADDPAQVRAFMDDVATRLDDAEGIGGVFYRIDRSAFEKRAPLFLDEDTLRILERLAGAPALARFTNASTPGARLAAIAALLDATTSMASQDGAARRPSADESAAMAAALQHLVSELERFSKGGDGPIAPLDVAGLRSAAGVEDDGGIDENGYLTTAEGRIGVMFVRPVYTRDEIEAVRPFVEAVRRAGEQAKPAHEGVTFGLTGLPASQIDETDTIAHDTKLTTAVALLGVVVLFLLFFPALRLLGFSLVPIVFGIVWTSAFIQVAFGYVNLMSSIFLVVLIGMGIDFSVHIVARFLEERRRGTETDDAARRAVERAGRGVVTGAVTSAGAFAAVGWAGFKGIEELGIAAAAGLMFTLFFALAGLPAVLALGGRGVDTERRRTIGIGPVVDFVLGRRALIGLVALAITVPSLWLAKQTPFEFSLLALLPEDAESAVLMAEMIEDRSLSANAVAIVANDLEEARAIETKLAKLERVHRVVSAATFIPAQQEEKLARLRAMSSSVATQRVEVAPLPIDRGLDELEMTLERVADLALTAGHKDAVDRLGGALDAIDEIRDRLDADEAVASAGVTRFDAALAAHLVELTRMLDEALALGPVTTADLPENLRRRFVGASGKFAVYAVPRDSIWDRPALGRFLEDVRGVHPEVTGFPETFYENADRIRGGFLRAAMYATFAVVLLLGIDLRRPSHVASALVPVGLGAVWMLGAMNVIGLHYNLANVVGLPLVIGVGIDNGVHVLHRFRESGSVRLAAVETGAAVTLSSLTTMVGFGSLAFASHRGYASLGQILFVGVGACLVATLTVLLVTLHKGRGG